MKSFIFCAAGGFFGGISALGILLAVVALPEYQTLISACVAVAATLFAAAVAWKSVERQIIGASQARMRELRRDFSYGKRQLAEIEGLYVNRKKAFESLADFDIQNEINIKELILSARKPPVPITDVINRCASIMTIINITNTSIESGEFNERTTQLWDGSGELTVEIIGQTGLIELKRSAKDLAESCERTLLAIRSDKERIRREIEILDVSLIRHDN